MFLRSNEAFSFEASTAIKEQESSLHMGIVA
jgi:hypothetical protein